MDRNGKNGGLVLTRKVSETILIDGRVRVTVLTSRSGRCRLKIEAPQDVQILRGELAEGDVA